MYIENLKRRLSEPSDIIGLSRTPGTTCKIVSATGAASLI